MSFFAGIDTQASAFEMGGGNMEPLPDNTKVVATCEEAKNTEYNGERYANLKWRVNLPKEYANRVIFQKLHIYDAEKMARARQMLAAISFNAGGRFTQLMQASGALEPDDAILQALTNSPMVLLLGLWELDDKSKSGNWVKAVSKYERSGNAPAQAAPAPVTPAPAPAAASVSFEGDVPF